MKILEDMSDDEIRALAATPTPPQAGKWTLTAPDGREWQASKPTDCLKLEIDERVPPVVALARIRRAMMDA